MPLLVPGRMAVQLPAGGAPGFCVRLENLPEALAGASHLALGPIGIAPHDEVLPAHVVPAVHADLIAGVAH